LELASKVPIKLAMFSYLRFNDKHNNTSIEIFSDSSKDLERLLVILYPVKNNLKKAGKKTIRVVKLINFLSITLLLYFIPENLSLRANMG
jgi:hypothetical protein